LRKVQLIWSVQDAAVAAEDARVATFHLAKISGGAVVDTWDAADFTALDAAFSTWWTNIKPKYATEISWDRIKVYKDGPAITPPQVPVYDADKNVPGTSPNDVLPPQCAMTVTEMAGTKPHWGRFYLPTPNNQACNTYGRIVGAVQTDIADSADIFYTACQTANVPAVVYRAALPEREKKNGTTLPARAASAWTVETVQVDDVFDVIRSRRWKYPLLRVQRGIGS
jgi:hypothetical protein